VSLAEFLNLAVVLAAGIAVTLVFLGLIAGIGVS